MPMFESCGGDDDVAAAEDRGVAGEAVAGVDADERDQAGQLGEPEEGEAVEAGRPGAVGVAGPAAAAFGEEHDRQPQPLGELEQAVLLAVVLQCPACRRARCSRTTWRCSGPLRPSNSVAVDRADAADQAVGGRVGDQVVEVAAAALGGDDERAVLDERAVVDEVGDVLARRAPAAARGAGRRRRGGPRRARRGGARSTSARSARTRCPAARDAGRRPCLGRRRRTVASTGSSTTSRSPGITAVPTLDEQLVDAPALAARRRRGASSSTR